MDAVPCGLFGVDAAGAGPLAIAPPARDALVAALRARGVGFYAPSDAEEGLRPLNSPELVEGLASSDDPRLRDALAVLFLRRPDLAEEVCPLVESLEAATASVLRTQYTAAACLHRMWRTTLANYLPDQPPLPDLFGSDLDLPSLDDHFGELALRTLADRSPYNQLAAWHAVVDQLLAQLAREARS